jgi:3-deoxy-D-manno-octulosonate 8-phosphate phosphatase (KDO 8-P phosphatase)
MDVVVILDEQTLRSRARSIRLVLTDVDGVLTDGGVYVSERGEELKRFSLRDGMAVERLRDFGIDTAFVTRERSGFAPARAAKLGVQRVYSGVTDKLAQLPAIEVDTGVSAGGIAYIGDDVNDVEIMHAVVRSGGLTAAPADAFDTALEVATFVARAAGGRGALREFVEWLLRLRRGASLASSPIGSTPP